MGDQLQCDLLELHFKEFEGQKLADSSAKPPSPEPHELIAIGQPVKVQAPSRGIAAQAERIEFDLHRQKLRMVDRKRLTLHHEQFTVRAPELEYRFIEDEQLGQLWCAGPGRLEGRFGPQARAVEVAWDGGVQLLPAEDGRVLSVKGARLVSVESLGQVSAEELELYLSER